MTALHLLCKEIIDGTVLFVGSIFAAAVAAEFLCNKNKGVTVQPFNIMYYVRSVKRQNGFLSFENFKMPTLMLFFKTKHSV